MSFEEQYREGLRQILEADPRYPAAAYDFVRAAVGTTAKMQRARTPQRERRHVSGQELLEGFRELVLDQFGPLGITVLDAWNVRRSEDVGNIVFNLVENGLLGASEEDSPADFADGFDFTEAFVRPFVRSQSVPADLPVIDADD